MVKRKAQNKVGSNRRTKKVRLYSSSDDEEEFHSVCSSCDYEVLFEVEQNVARTGRNRRRKEARNRHALRNRSSSASTRRGGTRVREQRNAVQYQRKRPRCTPRREAQQPAHNLRRKNKKNNRQALKNKSASASSRRGGTRTRQRRTQEPHKRTKPRKKLTGRSQNLDNNSCLVSDSASSNSSTMRLPTLEGPGQFLIIYSDPQCEEISNSEVNKTDCCKSCGQQIQENKKDNQTMANTLKVVPVPLAEVEQEQPVSSVQVSENNAKKSTEILDVEPVTLNSAQSKQVLETEPQLSRESLNELEEEPEENVFHILLVPQEMEDFADTDGVDIEAGGDGPHVFDQTPVELTLDGRLLGLINMVVSSDELETPQSSNSDNDDEQQNGSI